VNTRTPNIDVLRIQRTGVSLGGQHPKKKLLATADLVRDADLSGVNNLPELSSSAASAYPSRGRVSAIVGPCIEGNCRAWGRPSRQYSRTLAAQPSSLAKYVAMGVSELVMSGSALTRIKGCGKLGQSLTLYHVSLFDGTGRPLSQGFINHACGCCASTFQKVTYGIMLCPSCADQLGLAPLPKATTARGGSR